VCDTLAVQPSADNAMVGPTTPLVVENAVPRVRLVLHRGGEIRLFGASRGSGGPTSSTRDTPFPRVGELRNRDRGQNADDHDHDQKLNQSEPLRFIWTTSPCKFETANDSIPSGEFGTNRCLRASLMLEPTIEQ